MIYSDCLNKAIVTCKKDRREKVSAYDVNAEEEFLAIIGNGASRKNKALKYDRFGYKGYLFDKNSELFAEL